MTVNSISISNSDLKIMVTGARGFIGSRVALSLSAQGYDVLGLGRDNSPNKSGNDTIVYIQGDFGDKDRMRDILNDIHPHVIIHCAGVTPHKNIQDSDFFDVNVKGGACFLNAISDHGDIKFINASTIGVYGHPLSDDGVVTEGDACTPLSSYAQSKYEFENRLAQGNVPHVNLRIANIPGRDAFINYVLHNQQVQLNGDVPYIRDYIHLDDLARLFEKSVHYLMNGGESLTANAGSGVGLSFPDIVDEIEKQTGMGIDRTTADAKTGDVIKIICDISTAKQQLGWKPTDTNLKDIIQYALQNKTL